MPLLSEAGRFYVDMKGKAGDKRFERYTSRVVSEVIGLAGDKLVSAYTRKDALAFRDVLLARGSANATVKKCLTDMPCMAITESLTGVRVEC